MPHKQRKPYLQQLHPSGEISMFSQFDFHPAYDQAVSAAETPKNAGMRELARQLEERGLSIIALAGTVAVNAANFDQLRIF